VTRSGPEFDNRPVSLVKSKNWWMCAAAPSCMTNDVVRDYFLPFSCKLVCVGPIKFNRQRKSNVYKNNLNYLHVVEARDFESHYVSDCTY
jgi:hypothetical protein